MTDCHKCHEEDLPKRGAGCPPKVIQINNPQEPILFHRVDIPATLGDDTTYPPKAGLYKNVLLVYEANNHAYLYSSDGIPTAMSTSVPQEVLDDITDLQEETVDLQDQIDEIKNSPDVVDVVATKAALDAYDTSTLTDKDVVRVLADETHDGQSTYYRWDATDGTWSYIGAVGDYYTKSQTDDLLATKQNTLTAGANITIVSDEISATDTTYSAGTGLNLTGTTFSVDTTTIAEKTDIPTKTSDLTNDGSDNTSTYVEADELATVATSGSYTDLINKPTIPAAQIQSDWAQSDNTKKDYIKNKPNLATVATSGSYNDLSGKPTIPAAQVNSDWNASSGVAEILNKPSLATVATTGAYSDLTGTPTIPTVNNATLTVTQNGTSKGTFTANASSNKTIALTDTTYNNFTGADASTAGAAGLVPAPAAGDNTKYLSGDGTWKTVSQYSLPIATANDLGGIKVGSRLSINSSTGVLSANSQTDNNFTNTLKTKLDGIASGAEVNVQADWNEASSSSDAYIKNKPTIPAAQVNSDWNASSGVAQILNKPTLATVATSGSYNDLSDKPAGMVILSYGSSTWNDFITAYQENRIVYCRASSGSDPGSGSQTRLAFMAYVNNATAPTEVEFQYVRSVSTKSASNQSDQVFVYKLTSTGAWTVENRPVMCKLAAGSNMGITYSNNTLTLNADAQQQSDWSQSDNTKVDFIKNKPTIPTVNNATLTIQKNGTTVQTFTANASSNKTANIEVPVITMQTTDPGEGVALAANNFIAVYNV